MKTRQLTKHANKEERNKEFKFYCAKCDFGTFAEILFTRHLETKKHNTTHLEQFYKTITLEKDNSFVLTLPPPFSPCL